MCEREYRIEKDIRCAKIVVALRRDRAIREKCVFVCIWMCMDVKEKGRDLLALRVVDESDPEIRQADKDGKENCEVPGRQSVHLMGGCVRVERPSDRSAYLASVEGMSAQLGGE